MTVPVMQTSFHAGEWAPALNARVDLAKYRAAVALGENFFVDYRGGASTRPGTKYILQCFNSSANVRLIPFQASTLVSYVLEFGDGYIRFYNNGAPVVNTALNITGVTQANPAVVSVVNSYNTSDWVYITDIAGMTQLNGRYFRVLAATAGTITLGDLVGDNVDSTGYGAWTSGGTTQSLYYILSPYTSADLALIKFAQNINTLILTHHNYAPYVLTLIAATNWTLSQALFGATIAAPVGQTVVTTLVVGSANYAYVITAVDPNGQESTSSAFATLAAKQDLRTTAGTNTVSWTQVMGASSYNVYKAQLSYAGAVPVGTQFGFIGNCTGINFIDSNIDPDYSITPPIAKNPFQGAGVASVTVTAGGAYTTNPTVTFSAAPAGGITAVGSPVLSATSATVAVGGSGYNVGDTLTFSGNAVFQVASTVGLGHALGTVTLVSPGASTGTVANPMTPLSTSGSGINGKLNITWYVSSVSVFNPGAGYTVAPTVTFSSGAATATATLEPTSAGNPTVPSYFQQRLVLAGPRNNPQQFNMSQPGSYYNFNVNNPIQPDNAFEGTLVSTQLNSIKAMISMSAGLVILADRQAWVVNGGSAGSAATAIDATAQGQSYNGPNDVPPIVANFDVLYVQAKGSSVRDTTYNFQTNIYTGTDISVLSSHLFFGYHITEWAWAEEPFKVVWAVRNDGVMLTLTFLKEQELIGWMHSVTDGNFASVCVVTEVVGDNVVDAVYAVVEREVGIYTLKYVERVAERYFSNGVEDAWCVDSGLQYDGAPATSFTGGEHLRGLTCTGLADGEVIPPFVMNAAGTFTLATAASVVTVGLPFVCDLQTLAIDMSSQETIQGKMKKISSVDVRVENTLGLKIGSDEDNLVAMKDLIVGNVGSMTNEEVTGLVTGDARTIIDPKWTVPGQYLIRQDQPFPATILGVIPNMTLGDNQK